MKKGIARGLLAVALTVVAGASYAANGSFTDVPSTHWAYDAVARLAQAGLIDGYSDRAFRGDKNLNRYEFAVVVERAISKYERATEANKELIDKLSVEFVSELNRMGARVDRLEAKTSVMESKLNITVGGDTRMRFIADNPAAGSGIRKLHGGEAFDFRQRIKFSGTINEDVSWLTRVSTSYGNKWGSTDNAAGSSVYVDVMTVSAKNVIGIDSIRAGRSALDFFGNGLMGKPMAVDGILLNKKIGTVGFRGWTGEIKPYTGNGDANQLTTGELSYNVSNNLTMKAGYYWADIPGSIATMNVSSGSFSGSKGWSTAAVYKFSNYTLLMDYVSTTLDNTTGKLSSNPKGWSVQVSNGNGPGAKAAYYSAAPLVIPAKVGSDAWSVSYRSVDAGALPSGAGGFDTTAVANYDVPPTSINVFTKATDNVDVLFLAYQKVVAKNVVASLEYQDFKLKNKGLTNLSSDALDKTYMAKFEFFY
ncbi:S-layer homology domain-containing protein [Anaerospora hongkongensis]|uniref:S-layer homology domain-containing protein n=1 Tax=Anaerospora hongkongensis TaxID=244830 RepID=UPI00289C0885|nr:S-layer homology domain-containing protein [Anaerospora hongkongensis]